MIDGSAVLTVFLVYLAGVVTPGPNFVAVVHKAVATTRSEALALVAGIVVVNLFWSTCAIAGLGIVFAAFPWAAFVVKVLGAAYLMWFGLRLLINAGKNALGALNDAVAGSHRQSFIQGVITNIGNPKSMAFYAAVFSAAAPAHVSPATFFSMLAVVVVVSMTWYGMVAIALSHPKIASGYQRRKKIIDRLCGGLILSLGVRQLV
ncbi:LysE family translocator [Pseudomonas lurida]|jgi:threonine efflux protein|uniref:LysE family translocator n=1 Tax=Pseudomonas quebecensis TaxID=2995174 RepID=A0ABY6QN64_9PSED|nr:MULTISPECIES: LysE family translocator [Pseudomonas]MBA1296892.1 LysE family translocator [Pseudomonas lurida]MCX4063916.1 LysE family translocator [Pseudomonas quebecensis]UZW20203.1 LysE family translocator [Pseudomonas quebecensis]UZW22378.1 LysE family translocator [Pseudomonas quebecensis]UZW27439.1 LysE family translocator [Pseudomonas quebecensis]